jgi:hypothetical protein
VENIKKFLESNNLFTIYDFTGTLGFLKIVNNLSSKKQLMSVINSWYDDKVLIQAVEFNKDNDIVYVKRKINEIDSYTLYDFDFNKADIYEYLDMTEEDLINVIKSKYIHKGIFVNINENKEIEYIIEPTDNIVKTLIIKSDDTIKNIKYCDYNLLLIKNKSNSNDALKELDNIVGDNSNIELATLKYNVGFAILNIFVVCKNPTKNECLTKLLGCDFYGYAYIGIEDMLNKIERLMDIDMTLFNKILENINVLTKNPPLKNNDFCNIYYEILNIKVC